MRAIRNGKGMLVGMLDECASTFQIKDGKKIWLIQIPLDGLTIETIRGDGLPEEIYIPHNHSATKPN